MFTYFELCTISEIGQCVSAREWADGWIGGWVHGKTGGRTDEWMDEKNVE
jgi:hypothetical protein